MNVLEFVKNPVCKKIFLCIVLSICIFISGFVSGCVKGRGGGPSEISDGGTTSSPGPGAVFGGSDSLDAAYLRRLARLEFELENLKCESRERQRKTEATEQSVDNWFINHGFDIYNNGDCVTPSDKTGVTRANGH